MIVHTVNFSIMLCVPWKGSFSKLSIELGLCIASVRQSFQFSCDVSSIAVAQDEAYIEGSQMLTIAVERLVVKLNKLF